MSAVKVDDRNSSRKVSRAFTSPVIEAERLRKLSGHSKQSATTSCSRSTLVLYSVLAVLGIVLCLLGRAFLQTAVLAIGYATVALCIFLVASFLYAWWGAKNMDVLQFDVRKCIYCYLACVGGEVASFLVSLYIPNALEIPGLRLDAMDVITYMTVVLLMFCTFVNRNGLDAVFSPEALYYVFISVGLRYVSSATFDLVIPGILTSLLIHNSILTGLSLMLWKLRHPNSFLQLVNFPFNFSNTPSVISTSPSVSQLSSRRNSVTSLSSRSSMRQSRSSWSTYTSRNSSVLGFDPHLAIQAHGILGDLMLDQTLPKDVVQRLDSVQQLLAPRVTRNVPVSQHLVRTSIQHDCTDYETAIHSISSGSSSSVKRPSLLGIPSHVNRSSRFSTVTTASGMPLVEPSPHARKRVQGHRGSLHSSSDDAIPRSSVIKSPNVKPPKKSGSSSPLTRSFSSLDQAIEESDVLLNKFESSKTDLMHSQSVEVSAKEDLENVVAQFGRPKSNTLPAGLLSRQFAEMSQTTEDGGDDDRRHSTGSTCSNRSEIARHSSIIPPDLATIKEIAGNTVDGREEDEPELSTPIVKEKKDSSSLDKINSYRRGRHYSIYNDYKTPNLGYDIEEYEAMAPSLLQEVLIWDCAIDNMEKTADGFMLSRMAYCLFHEAGLIETFEIPKIEFINYFRALEINYGNGVYHNSTHAADVLHATAYLMSEPIPEFDHAFQEDDEMFRIRKTKGTGNMLSAFSVLELFACFLAAAMHDFDHPGKTNAFLVATRDPMAVLYNDRSVLENHHAAASWEMLTTEPLYNFLGTLDEAEYKRLRFLIIEAILATDLKMHFDIIDEFKTKIKGGGISWSSPEDRLMVMKMVIKMADINGPTKSWRIHEFWTERITEEFFRQGEEENRLGLAKTVFLEREHPEQLPKVQLSFIQNLVSPLFQVCAEAGLIPGQLSEEVDVRDANPTTGVKSDEDDELTESDVESDLDDAEAMKGKKFVSIILTNLEENYAKWQEKLPPENIVTEEPATPLVGEADTEGQADDTE